MNNKMPEKQTPVLFGENIDEKPQCKNLNKSNRMGRAEKNQQTILQQVTEG